MNVCPVCFSDLYEVSATTYMCRVCGQKVNASTSVALWRQSAAFIKNPKTIAALGMVVVVLAIATVLTHLPASSSVANNQPTVAEAPAVVEELPKDSTVFPSQPVSATVTPSAEPAAQAAPATLPAAQASAVIIRRTPPPIPTPKPLPAPVAPACTKGTFKPATGIAASYNKPGFKVTENAASSYEVNGYTATQIKSQLNVCSPILVGGKVRYAATSWWINYSYYSNKVSGGKCRMDKTKVAVTLQLRQDFPKWQTSSHDAAGLIDKWQSFMAGLTLHEKGHKDLANKYAKAVYDGLRSFPDKTCTSFNKEANKFADAKVNELRKADADYDAKTDYGATQGAILP